LAQYQGSKRDKVLLLMFPTLAELNDDICPFPWLDKEECTCVLSGNNFKEAPNLYHGLPLSLAVLSPPPSLLVASIIASSNCLFFISHSLGNPNTHKWRLVLVAFSDNTTLSPSCLQDKRFLMELYTLHHPDVCFNAINQRCWLQYHSMGNISTPSSSTMMHLIWLSDTSEAHATCLHHVLFHS
jgi:hypothetical protein